MKFELREKFGALPAQAFAGLPDFVAITGLNGSGKSSFLEAVKSRKCAFRTDQGEALNVCVFADSETLRQTVSGKPNERRPANRQQNTERDYEWLLLEEVKAVLQKTLKNPKIEEMLPELDMHLETGNPDNEASQVLSFVIRGKVHDLDSLAKLDLSAEVGKYLATKNGGVVGLDFLELSDAYAAKLMENDFRNFRAKEGKSNTTDPLTDQEFREKFGPKPWDLGNELLVSWGLDVFLTEAIGAHEPNEKVSAAICSRTSQEEIPHDKLSSGEQTLLTLLSEYYQASVFGKKPDLMLLDEPDAMLNPALSNSLVDMLTTTFCNKLGVKVIMTTHSPTTVAAVPEGSHFVMSRDERKLRKSTREEAIAQLLVGTPELTLLTQNTRQVFCESDLDARDYGQLYSICRAYHSDKLPTGQLNFIAFGRNAEQPGNASRGQVEDLVSMLAKGGNPLARGLVDWDASGAVDKQGIVVSSKGLRYSKENVILDPLFIGLFIVKADVDHVGKLTQSGKLSFSKFSVWTDANKQKLIDETCAAVLEVFPNTDGLDQNCVDVKYSDGVVLKSPKWWMSAQGHLLETKICEAFPVLRGKQHQPLCGSVVAQINKDTELVLDELLSTFRALLT